MSRQADSPLRRISGAVEIFVKDAGETIHRDRHLRWVKCASISIRARWLGVELLRMLPVVFSFWNVAPFPFASLEGSLTAHVVTAVCWS